MQRAVPVLRHGLQVPPRRREQLLASDAQIRVFDAAMRNMTSLLGNYRTTMPLNGRPIAVRNGVREEPPPLLPGVNTGV